MIKLKCLTPLAEEKLQRTLQSFIDQNEKKLTLNVADFATEAIPQEINIDEHKHFKNKFELAEYLVDKLRDIQQSKGSVESGIWNFLIIVYYKQLLSDKNTIGEIGRFFIAKTSIGRTSLRDSNFVHLLKSPFELYYFYKNEPDLIKFLLINPVNQNGGLFLGIVKRQNIMKNENFIRVSQKLFYDATERKLKSGNNEQGQRLVALFNQYERTYDLYGMPPEMILEKLIRKHQEFADFM